MPFQSIYSLHPRGIELHIQESITYRRQCLFSELREITKISFVPTFPLAK